MDQLRNRINEKEFDNEFSKKLLDSEDIFNEIYRACGNKMETGSTGNYGLGSILIGADKYEYSINMYSKQKLLYEKTKNVNSLLEIGTYMGHSLLIMLLANPKINITCIDIDDTYSARATKYLQSVFTYSKINFIKGNSLKVLPKIYEKFDFFHVDGAHGNTIITQEFAHCRRLSSSNDFKLIFDDVDICQTLQKNIDLSYKTHEAITSVGHNKSKYSHIILSSNLKDRKKEDNMFRLNVILSFLKELPARFIRRILR